MPTAALPPTGDEAFAANSDKPLIILDKRYRWQVALTLAGLAILFALELVTGPASGLDPALLAQLRVPRALAAALVGAALAGAGTCYQQVFRNPLASPDLLGVAPGAALGAALAIVAGLPAALVQACAFAGATLAVAFATGIASRLRAGDPVLSLLLAGIAIGAAASALLTLLTALADPSRQLPAITYWMLGSFSSATPADALLALVPVAAAIVPMMLLAWRVNLLALPDDEAAALGADVRRLRRAVIGCATLAASAAVALAGIVGWIGLLAPHFAGLLAGGDFARRFPVAIAVGAAATLGVDVLSRAFGPPELPPGALAALIGAPLLLWLLARGARGES